jgi:mannose-6-phosphate isomerase-like protein (cupin superfamily)
MRAYYTHCVIPSNYLDPISCYLCGCVFTQGGYFVDFISTRGIQAGIIRLHPGEIDTQGPHSVDDVYYVIEGNGFIKVDGKDHQIREGTSIFVPAKADHRFHGNKQDLVIFYALGARS